ncbi:MAG: peptidase C11 [Oscillospiraceae bacterium]|nr:peptidase C11 [Oscillospiraceae bacterium]
MENNKPRGREKNVTGPGKTVQKRGEGLGTGPVGDASGYQDRKPDASTRNAGTQRSGGGGKLIALLLALLLGGGGGLTALLGGQSGQPAQTNPSTSQQQQQQQFQTPTAAYVPTGLNGGSVSSGWQGGANTGKLNTSVAPSAREKYTKLLGNGRDTATIMVYMCGTDLESRSSMGTYDLQEMLAAKFGNEINLLVYTGGCKGWRNNQISSETNQIWQVKNGQMVCLERDLGAGSMTDPSRLAGYIQYCKQHFPASRYELILWDHGGGSVSGYGYDEKFASSGSMDLAGLDSALKTAGVKFDFIGFDACLMATAETALTMAQYADYLVASEETEPGVGWYYTDWLTAFGADPSMPTVQLGQKIVDSFVDVCAQKCPGQDTTLSVVDLAELEATLPDALADFSRSTADLIRKEEYQAVSNARDSAREFAKSSKIDQIDLVHLAQNLGTKEGKALADVLLEAVKYNRTSSRMTNAYGLSIYFPYRKTATVDKAASTFAQIGMDEDYTKCIRQFADVVNAGKAASSSSGSPLPSLLGTLGGGAALSAEDISALLGAVLGGRSLDMENAEEYLAAHRFPEEALVWQTGEDGVPALYLSEEQWGLVQSLELNLFYDDGEGYIDLGLDTTYDFNEDGGLAGVNENTWLAIDGQPVAYYHTVTFDDGTSYAITGRVPVLHNGSRAELLVTFDSEQPKGYVAGVQSVYHDGETDTTAKSQTELLPGDTLEFLCDYYSYSGEYQDSYLMGETLTVTEEALTVSDVLLEGSTRATYCFTDLYGQRHWSPVLMAEPSSAN